MVIVFTLKWGFVAVIREPRADSDPHRSKRGGKVMKELLVSPPVGDSLVDLHHFVTSNGDDDVEDAEDAIVYVVDSDPFAGTLIEDIARMKNLECRQFTTGRDFFAGADLQRSGCVVMELRGQDISGLDIQHELERRGSSLPVIFISGQSTVSIAVYALRAGALHFLQKPLRDQEVFAAIDEAIAVNRCERESRSRKQRFRDAVTKLTPGERQLLERLLDGCCNREAAEELGVAVRTVELRRSRLMKKLGVRSLPELVRTVLISDETLLRQPGNRLMSILDVMLRAIPAADVRQRHRRTVQRSIA
jgi:FixJ family two-component response regulator